MDSTDESFTTFTIKGRRTKRQRTTTTTTTTTTTSSHVGLALSDEDHDAMSSITTTEEEDMANCLLLLSRGVLVKRKPHQLPKNNSKTKVITQKGELGSNPVNNSNKKTQPGVYECKTCTKTFSSFQALGGHRTGHKKVNVPKPPPKNDFVHDELIVFDHFTTGCIRVTESDTTKNKRVHVCSICTSEFQSGQALGGHMRRHRPVIPTTISNDDSCEPTRNNILLDLNLPALDDHDDNLEIVDTTKFDILPSTVLVDCHY